MLVCVSIWLLRTPSVVSKRFMKHSSILAGMIDIVTIIIQNYYSRDIVHKRSLCGSIFSYSKIQIESMKHSVQSFISVGAKILVRDITSLIHLELIVIQLTSTVLCSCS
ncbi:hypothetical protein D3C86_1736210 [compost metagenome]